MLKLSKKVLNKIETERLILRRWHENDFADFYEFASDSEVMPLAGSKPVKKTAEAQKEFVRYMKKGDCFAIVLKENNKAIGSIKFQKDIRRFRVDSLSIGYELNRDYWGHGYMPEALAAMMKYGFEQKKIEILGIGHFAGNEKSKRVIEKCGFKHEGTIRKGFMRYDGKIFDDEAYSITKEEYFGKD